MVFSYSARENQFLMNSFKDTYLKNGLWPDDAKEVDDIVANEFMGQPPDNKVRAPNNDGMPVWVDIDLSHSRPIAPEV